MPAKTFIAISTVIHEGKLIAIHTSAGASITDEYNGLTFDKAITFLFNLRQKRKRKQNIVFVCYAFSRDNEFIFSTMPRDMKDKLFRSYLVKNEIDLLEAEQEGIDEQFYNADVETFDLDQADFNRYVNKMRLHDLVDVEYKGYNINLNNGKILTIRRKGKAVSIYDVFGFFKPTPLRQVVKDWLNKDIALLDSTLIQKAALNQPVLDVLTSQAQIECKCVAEVAAKLHIELSRHDINLRRYHGASSVTSTILHKAKARKCFHNYRYRRQHAPELWRAVKSAQYGGRSEQFKLGTAKDVKIFDINSAYAFACTFLPFMLEKPRHCREWVGEPFSLWFCEYDFTSENLYLGLLPHREFDNTTRYKLRGRGYFWQPEVAFVLANYPHCIEVKRGFALGYEQAPFAFEIEQLYQLRLDLQRQKNPLEKVIKLALASFYGKFAQHQGKGYFYNPFYAGFITSFTRAQLLTAVQGYETETIAFQTDAIHTQSQLPLPLSASLGAYKVSEYDRITYVDNGVYRAVREGRTVKAKTRGFRSFDFAKAIAELNQKSRYTGLAEFFIGHNVFTQAMFSGAHYLEHFKTDKIQAPALNERMAMRVFEITGVDLNEALIDSKPVNSWNGADSTLYNVRDYNEADFAIDTIQANRI